MLSVHPSPPLAPSHSHTHTHTQIHKLTHTQSCCSPCLSFHVKEISFSVPFWDMLRTCVQNILPIAISSLQSFSCVRLGPNPVPAARDSIWREGWCRRVTTQPLSFLGLHIYFKFKVFFYTFTKALGQKFDIFSSPSPRFIISMIHCCSSNRVPASAILSVSALPSIIYFLFLCPIVHLWLYCNSCYIPRFISYLSKSYLPLTSWAHYLLKRLLTISILTFPNLSKL